MRESDHPRACGENEKMSPEDRRPNGSPPRMRGKLFTLGASPSACRITPAHAGKTISNADFTGKSADHPPRMRGKPRGILTLGLRAGITPAHAGKTRRQRPPPPSRTDHPRACGENVRPWSRISTFSGSPPRMRGKQQAIFISVLKGRITPAHAGKTYRVRHERGTRLDHPRACGEN